MFALYGFTLIASLVYTFHKVYSKLYKNKLKSFEDKYEGDEYKLLCYRVKLEDDRELMEGELTDEDIESIEDKMESKIKSITIEYMFNGELMKYITYTKDIRFPIYSFDISHTKYMYYPELIFLNGVDVTKYIHPWLGPYCNFYLDREEPIKLEDALIDHPDYDNLDFKEGTLMMISNETPLDGRKCIIKPLPCKLIWKRHAAVDPRKEYLLDN
jgi:hypothetical protein|tara:strand:- start:6642 stop:7283 length:642 start_codon:yes stop_codon:yes gene_type:complete